MRGMRGIGVPIERLRRNLEQWLQLSIHQGIPPGILILSRAMIISEKVRPVDAIKNTLAKFSDEQVEELEAHKAESADKVRFFAFD